MSEKSEISCITPRCKESISKYGEQYHAVYSVFIFGGHPPTFMPDAIAHCEHCGGYTNGMDWKHVCEKCGKDIAPGKLTGLFVPHLCQACEQAIADRDKASGNVCLKCHVVRSRCCC